MEYKITITFAESGNSVGSVSCANFGEVADMMRVFEKPAMFGNGNFRITITREFK